MGGEGPGKERTRSRKILGGGKDEEEGRRRTRRRRVSNLMFYARLQYQCDTQFLSKIFFFLQKVFLKTSTIKFFWNNTRSCKVASSYFNKIRTKKTCSTVKRIEEEEEEEEEEEKEEEEDVSRSIKLTAA